MKKLVKIVVAIALALSMSITVFASPSSTVDGTVKIIDGVFDDGTTMDDQNYIAAREVQSADKQNVDSAVADINTTLKNAGVTSTKTMKVVSSFSVYQVGSTKMSANVTFAVTGLTAGKEAKILQYVNGAWVDITTGTGDGTLTGKITCDGPIIIAMEDSTTPSDKGSSDKGSSGSGTSGSSASGTSSTSTAATSAAASGGQKGPATGVTFAWPALIAALALAGMSILTLTDKKKAR